ncbi:MAG: hypothetical protein ACK5YR_09105 [Pirellula sp.]|jgi:hypothetical protein
MKQFLLIVIALSVTALNGCSHNADPSPTDFELATQDSQSGTVRWVDPKEIHQGPVQRDSLTDEQTERIKVLQQTFVEIDGQTIDQWIDSFKRDLNPDKELAIWERMARAYTAFCHSRELSLDEKKEAYKIVLLRSMASPEDVLARIELKLISKIDAEIIMSGF